MYILIEKDSNFVGIFKDKSEIAKRIDKNRATITRNLIDGRYETDKFVIIVPDFIQKISNRGGKR